MTKMNTEFDAEAVVDALEAHRNNISEGMFEQAMGNNEGALTKAIESLNLLAQTLMDVLGEENRRELRQLTTERHGVSAYFDLEDDVEFCDEYDRTHAS